MEEFTCKMLRFMRPAVFIHVCVSFTGTYVKTVAYLAVVVVVYFYLPGQG